MPRLEAWCNETERFIDTLPNLYVKKMHCDHNSLISGKHNG